MISIAKIMNEYFRIYNKIKIFRITDSSYRIQLEKLLKEKLTTDDYERELQSFSINADHQNMNNIFSNFNTFKSFFDIINLRKRSVTSSTFKKLSKKKKMSIMTISINNFKNRLTQSFNSLTVSLTANSIMSNKILTN